MADPKEEALESFRRVLVKKHGSVFQGWRLCLDPDGIGCITYPEFSGACRTQLAFSGTPDLVWAQMALNEGKQESDFLSIRGLDPVLAEGIEEFTSLMEMKCGSSHPVILLRKGFQCREGGRIEVEDFVETLKALGYHGSKGPQATAAAKRLFRWLQPDEKTRFLTLGDLEGISKLRLKVRGSQKFDSWAAGAPSPSEPTSVAEHSSSARAPGAVANEGAACPAAAPPSRESKSAGMDRPMSKGGGQKHALDSALRKEEDPIHVLPLPSPENLAKQQEQQQQQSEAEENYDDEDFDDEEEEEEED